MLLLILKFFAGLALLFLAGHLIGCAIERIFHITFKSYQK